MSEIVRTDTLFGSKKNIIGSTSADLVLETLGKVYIKTGKSAKTLTEILSEYSKSKDSSDGLSITAEEILALLSKEYIKSLVDLVLLEHKIYGEFVTVDTLRDVGNENLPIYFDYNSEPKTINGLSVENKIETEDSVYADKGIYAGGIGDLEIFGAIAGSSINEEWILSQGFLTQNDLLGITSDIININTSVSNLSTLITNTRTTLTNLVNGKKDKLQNLTFSGTNIQTLTTILQNTNGEIIPTFANISEAGAGATGLITSSQLLIDGQKMLLEDTFFNKSIVLKYPNTNSTPSIIAVADNSDAYPDSDHYSSIISFARSSSNKRIYFCAGSSRSGYATQIYTNHGKSIYFYGADSNHNVYKYAELNQYGLSVEGGIFAGGIEDLTISTRDAQILSLQQRITELEEQIANLS